MFLNSVSRDTPSLLFITGWAASLPIGQAAALGTFERTCIDEEDGGRAAQESQDDEGA